MIKGPVEFIVISFAGDKLSPEIVPAVAEVIDKGIVRIIDLIFIRKDEEGGVNLIEFEDFEGTFGDAFDPLVDIVTGLVADEDVTLFAAEMENDSSAVAIVFEHLWAIEFGDAVVRNKGKLVANGYIPRAAVLEILETYGEPAK